MKRILFVDDEPHLLAGLKRRLRAQREAWDMVFVSSGTAALAALAQRSFDVVVSDMCMPGIDGVSLLRRVQASSPRTVRIILSGYADLKATMRSVEVSHQCLSKPCDAEELRTTVESACALDALLSDSPLRDLLGDVVQLPVLPNTYRALLEALGEPDIDLREIGAIVEQDQGITTRLLQFVNSSFLGAQAEVTSVAQAISHISAQTVRDLLLSTELFRPFEVAEGVPGFSLEAEQEHSLLTSRIAARLVDEEQLASLASLAGMLHDFGKLVLASHMPKLLTRTLAACAEFKRPSVEVEEDILGVSHAEIGAYVLGLWGMPALVVEAVAHHHHPLRVTRQDGFGVLAAVHVAQALARLAEGDDGEASRMDEEFIAKLGVSDRLPEWNAIATEERARVSALA